MIMSGLNIRPLRQALVMTDSADEELGTVAGFELAATPASSQLSTVLPSYEAPAMHADGTEGGMSLRRQTREG